MLTERRVKKGRQALLGSNSYHNVVFFEKEGNVTAEIRSTESLESDGYIVEDRPSLMYVRGEANPIKEVEPPEDMEDVLNHGQIGGFIPTTEWKSFRDQKAAQEVFHRKKSRDIPWRVLIGLGIVVFVVIVLVQGGII